MVVALNKMDRLASDIPLQLNGIAATLPKVQVSGLTGAGVEELLQCISKTLIAQFDALDVIIPYDRGDLVAQFHQFGTIEHETFEEQGTHLRGFIPNNHSSPFKTFQIVPLKGQNT
jgi:GTP-binding protein HflX